ncbi:galectin-8 isoform X1 [Varanus komodoensis]|uniref:galectin-8 isoform X1 n=1 Tax=Varanus komodoensis TaxID=61221 RepID=UPI001CF7937C|nr:galectin-8 isoform X1 [Varanus komodoensis]XP_044275847.1 galectin-8 isoform X1 [Varanus komodoensis]XP_044275857.1 galectin-8 isoform X1 [Varanus komodoensis]
MISLDNFRRTVKNPAVPYTASIIGGLLPGELVIIRGSVPKDADRFQVDFQCGSSTKPRADVAFHFNPRFKKSGCIVCNTLQSERWGSEEIAYEMPFERGKPFEIVFMVLPDKFQVSVNGRFLLLYKYRIQLEKIDTLGIFGKVQVGLIEFVSNKPSQSSQPSLLESTEKATGNVCTPFLWLGFWLYSAYVVIKCFFPFQQNEPPDSTQFVVPYTARINSSLEPGRTIVIKGEVKEKANSFAINLRSCDSNDIALHLNPRIKVNKFVRNSYLSGGWGEEETHISHFPFKPGMYFELIILCEAHQYNVAINGVHTLEYKHRFKQLGKINILEISGDIQLLDVRSW